MAVRRYVKRRALPEFSLWEKMRARKAAIGFDLEITARCNLRCRHCDINVAAADAGAKKRELTAGEIENIATEAVSMGAVWCLITGGEPLLRRDFPEIYLGLRKRGLLLSVYTNACLISDEHVRLFKAHPPRDVEVTVYGVTEETYERVSRVKGSYKAFRTGLQRLVDSGIRVRLKAMALRSNLSELGEISTFCRAGTKDFFRFDPFLQLRLDRDPAKNKDIEAERLTPDEIAAADAADPERFRVLLQSCEELILPAGPGHDRGRLFRCAAGENHFVVGHDGRLRLCLSLVHPDLVIDLRGRGLKKAWERLVSRARGMRSSRPEYLEKCGRCPIINYCQWCPATAFLETGELDRPVEVFCRAAKARVKALNRG